jgi:uncharacterized coiled-coil protein SlyX
MKHLIEKIIKQEKKLDNLNKIIKEKNKKLLDIQSKVCFHLYEEFIENNWNKLDSANSYFKIQLDKKLIIREIKFEQKYNDDLAVFKPIQNINLYKNLTLESFDTDRMVVDKKQLEYLSKYYNETNYFS